MLDIHCHIIPCVDDGARSFDEAVAMLRAAADVGVRRIIATPHVYDADGDTGPMRAGLSALIAPARGLGITLLQGFEVNWRVLASASGQRLRSLCVAGTDVLLLELPEERPFPGCKALLTALRRDMRVVIVHPERLRYLSDLLPDAAALHIELQIDAESLFAPHFSYQRRAARGLYRRDLAHYVASDAHCPGDYAALQKAARLKRLPFPQSGILHGLD